MKEKLKAMINAAINNKTSLRFMLESGMNAASVEFIPEDLDEGFDNFVIYSGDNVFTVGVRNIEYDEVEEGFCCSNGLSFVTISAK